MPSNVRLQKYIAECGIASRRKAEEMIAAGKVNVNGQVVTKLGTKIDPLKDKISINGKPLTRKEEKIYIKLNKPRGVVSSCRKHPGEKTILDLIKDIPGRLFPVGRLDSDSDGLMILTNDGELANYLMHPRYEHEKEYVVNVKFIMTDDKLRHLEQGVVLEGKKTLPTKVFKISSRCFRIVLREGKKRQIRRMVEALGNRAVKLKRIRIKNVHLGKLGVGEYELLSLAEIESLTH